MTPVRAILTLLTSGFLFGAIGAAFGAGIGAVAPDYYRIVFRLRPDFTADYVRLGLSLGALQGFALGLFLAVLYVGFQFWRDVKLKAVAASAPASRGDEF
jgi:hypothetical protein